MPKMAALERAHREYDKAVVASKDPEFVKMHSSGLHVYPEVFKKADLLKICRAFEFNREGHSFHGSLGSSEFNINF